MDTLNTIKALKKDEFVSRLVFFVPCYLGHTSSIIHSSNLGYQTSDVMAVLL